MSHVNRNQNKAGVVTVIPDETYFRAETITQEKRKPFYNGERKNSPELGGKSFLNVHVFNPTACVAIENRQTERRVRDFIIHLSKVTGRTVGAAEIAPRCRAHIALAEVPSSVPSTATR